MKLRQFLSIFVIIIFASIYQISCGGSSADSSDQDPDPGGDETDYVVLSNGLEDVATDATLKYTFSSALDAESITTSTVYILPIGSAADKDLSADFEIAVDDYSYQNSCEISMALSGINVESDGESVTVTSDYEYMGGVIYTLCIDAEETAVIFSTEGDMATDCAALFNGECDYDAEADEGTSVSYDDMITLFDGNEEYLGACCVYGTSLGESECMSITTIDALFESLGVEEEEDEAMSWEGDTPDRDSATLVESLSGETELFVLQAKINQDPSTFGGNPYRLYGSDSDTTPADGATMDISIVDGLWSYDESVDDNDDNCLDEGSCNFSITGNMLAEIFSPYGLNADNWNSESRCVRVHFIMYYVSLHEGAPEGGDYTTHTSDLGLYIKNSQDAVCND